MRRFIILFVSALILLLPGCNTNIHTPEGIRFYYLDQDYLNNSDHSAVISEHRDVISREDDLPYLISLYLVGPLSENLSSPFPSYIRLISVVISDQSLTVELSEIDSDMSDSEYTLACACLSMTIFEIHNTEEITIHCSDRAITLTRDSVIFYDTDLTPEREDLS